MARTVYGLGLLSAAALLLVLGGCGGSQAVENQEQSDTTPGMTELVAALHSEFVRLGVDPDKQPAAAPTGSENQTFFLQTFIVDPDGPGGSPPTGVELYWAEQCVGDYDQNGEVGISDLTPLGQFFGTQVTYDPPSAHSGFAGHPTGAPEDDGGAGAGNPPVAGSPAENWRRARIDGDANGELNISDITPIASHWAIRLDGYRVYRKLPGEVQFSMLPHPETGIANYSVSRPPVDNTRPVLYGYLDDQLGITAGVIEYYIAPYDGLNGHEGIGSEVVAVDLSTSGNQPPVAALTADKTAGDVIFTVNFDASGSTDPDGTIAKYEWDWEGDGTYDHDSGTTATAKHDYNGHGTFNATVRVTDDGGLTRTATLTIHAYMWTVLQPDPSLNDVGGYSSLAWINAAPGISYYDYTSQDLYYLPAAQPDGSTWNSPQLIDWVGEVGACCSLAEVEGRAAISYCETAPAQNLKYARATNAEGTTWGAPQTIFLAGVDTVPTKLMYVNGRPSVVFSTTGASNSSINFFRAQDGTGGSWPGAAEVIGLFLNLGWGTGMCMVNTHPAVCYRDGDSDWLIYFRADNPEGSYWDNMTGMEVVDNSGNAGQYMSMMRVMNHPAIAYYGANSQSLMFVRADNSDGTSWGTATEVATGNVGSHCSLAVVGNVPAIACQNAASQSVVYYEANDNLGMTWCDPSVIGFSGTLGGYCSLIALSNGQPALSYYDNSQNTLRYAYRYE